jgi:phage terminase large subunit-like protein
MGKRGPQALAVEELKQRGTYRADRHASRATKKDERLDHRPPVRSKSKCGDPAKWVREHCRAADEKAIANGAYFDESRAAYVVEWFKKYLRHSKSKWAGEPFELLDWQRDDIIYPLFGWMRANGTRRFRRTYIEIPKKNGKSTLASGIGLYLLAGDGEMGAEVYSAATDREQASIVHNEAINMVEASPELAAFLKVNRSTKNILHSGNRSYYRAVSAKPQGKEGFNGNGCIIDELHAWHGSELWDALKYMGRSRPEPLHFVITTAGDDMESICRKQHDYAQSVLDGTFLDDRFFAYICSAGEEVGTETDYRDHDVWRRANPSMGITIDEDEFGADLEEAARSPREWQAFLRYSFNKWATSEAPWLQMDKWHSCREEFTAEDLRDEPCWIGLDLSRTRDMCAAVAVFPGAEEDETYRILPFFWLPEEEARAKAHLVSYLPWSEEGHLELVPGEVIEQSYIKRRLIELSEQFEVQALLFDRIYAEELTLELEENHGIPRVEFPQTMSQFAGPSALFERLIIAGRMKHNGHPVLTWQAGHVSARWDANNNLRPIKHKPDDYRKVDGIVATVMALAGASAGRCGRSYYEDHALEAS